MSDVLKVDSLEVRLIEVQEGDSSQVGILQRVLNNRLTASVDQIRQIMAEISEMESVYALFEQALLYPNQEITTDLPRATIQRYSPTPRDLGQLREAGHPDNLNYIFDYSEIRFGNGSVIKGIHGPGLIYAI